MQPPADGKEPRARSNPTATQKRAKKPKPTPDDELLRRVAESRSLLARHKRRHQERLEAGDDQAAVAEPESIARLEVRLWNLESLLRVRSLTRL
jgi:hypothetical protein